jgi:nucleoside-diphosphate-sugar epimerase
MSYNWTGKKVLVTGGAAFIGSTLTDRLVERGAKVTVVDNLSSGTRDNLAGHLEAKRIEFIEGDLLDPAIAKRSIEGNEVVFHLAADHGGRGYVDLHQVECSTNFMLDSLVFKTCHETKVDKIVFASSGCAYPNFIQTDTKEILYLTEEMVGPPYDADHLYGWAKLMGELTLQAYHKQFGTKCASCRYFTVYGPRGVENHAVIAMIARAFLGTNPFEVWGNGEQIRNWTYIDDIVSGTIAAAEKIDDGTPINLGTMERVRVIDAVQEILRYTNTTAELKFLLDMPTGPMNRVADNSLAKSLLDWEPQTMFMDGLHKTIDWYYSTKDRDQVRSIFARMLTER